MPIVTPDGVVFSYLLNTKVANPGQTKVVSNAVAKAGGVVVQAWPQIGVVVAHSDRATFRTEVAKSAGNALDSVGATRSVPVSEGTPTDVSTTWGKGASGYKQGAKKPVNGDVPGAEAPAAAADPREAEQWDMQMIKADQAHKITDGSRNVLVGVLDSGIDADHPDLVANLDVANSVSCVDAGRPSTTGWEPTTSDHGTHVAGTIAAARNGVGIVGVAPNVRLASVKVVNDDGFIYPEYAVCGFVEAGLKHMDVTNNSYYVDPFEFYCDDQPDQHAAKEAVRRAVTWSTKEGVVHAAAAGNSAKDLRTSTLLTRHRQPGRRHPGHPDPEQHLRRHPDRARRRRHRVVGAALPGRDAGEPAVELLEPRTRRHRRGRPGLDDPVDDRREQRLRHQERHLDGLAARGGRPRADEVGAPDWTPAQMITKLRQQADDKACSAATGGVAVRRPGRGQQLLR